MKIKTLPALFAGALALALTACYAGSSQDELWTPLLDEQLSQWTPFLGVPDPEIAVSGYTYEKGKPVGLRDPKGVYTVEIVEGVPVLRITGEVFGGLTSKQKYQDFQLRFQFRWGQKKWPPRQDAPKRDGGFIYHAFGEHGFFMNTWKHGAQFQIQEGDVGDFFPLFEKGAFKADVSFANKRYAPGAPPQSRSGGIPHGVDYVEAPNGEWNTCELIAIGADAVHVVNGRVVNVLRNLRYVDVKSGSKQENPLSSGQFQIQSEGAEMEFRNIVIRPAKQFPPELAAELNR